MKNKDAQKLYCIVNETKLECPSIMKTGFGLSFINLQRFWIEWTIRKLDSANSKFKIILKQQIQKKELAYYQKLLFKTTERRHTSHKQHLRHHDVERRNHLSNQRHRRKCHRKRKWTKLAIKIFRHLQANSSSA